MHILLYLSFVSVALAAANFYETKDPADLDESAKVFLSLWKQQKRDTMSHWCCAVTPPSKPVFSADGHLLHYQEQPCPDTHIVCCKGFINIQGQCFSFNEIQDILPAWAALFSTFGSQMSMEQILNTVHSLG
ncbi:unnamed protein product [Didymodactylos carnosus]|uniref:Uncharacterized protein n=1 Tax=Didymodactylos carnosus TaxID=1234261 RepID=A0A814PFA6_9BILA|nr:unnamed protein product [Didymodactylos carnosus]CAF3869609.1 unnamed protein product [Didymodactylos carnosus]